MIAVDTNLLVYAHREDSPWHQAAYASISRLAEGGEAWAIPWPCIHEFLAIVTHTRIYSPPTPLSLALEQVDAWMESPNLLLLGESDLYWNEFRGVFTGGNVAGAKIHDARIAALCLLHGVQELWTADRDFKSFKTVPAYNPLLG